MGTIVRRTRLVTVLIASALPSAAFAVDGGERLVSPQLSGYVVGYTAGNESQNIREEVPRGETVQAWTRMVTTQRFTGLAARISPADYAKNILSALPRQCPGAAISPVANISVGNRSAARFQVDCPRSAGGKAETFLLLAVSGRSDMHVKQVAFRGDKTPGDLSWARGYLAATVLCAAGDKRQICH